MGIIWKPSKKDYPNLGRPKNTPTSQLILTSILRSMITILRNWFVPRALKDSRMMKITSEKLLSLKFYNSVRCSSTMAQRNSKVFGASTELILIAWKMYQMTASWSMRQSCQFKMAILKCSGQGENELLHSLKTSPLAQIKVKLIQIATQSQTNLCWKVW